MLTLLQIPGGFFPKDACFGLGRSLWSVLQRQGSSLTHTDCIIQGDIGTQIYHLFPVISACLGTGGLQTLCHVCSLVVWGLCYKDQNSEFLFIFIYCHFLGAFLSLGNSAEEWVFLLVLPMCTPLQSPLAMEISWNTRGHGTGSVGLLLYFRSFSKCGGRNSAGSSQENPEAAVGQSMGSLEAHWQKSYSFWMLRNHSGHQNTAQTGNAIPQNWVFLPFPLCLSPLLSHCCCQTSTGRWEHWITHLSAGTGGDSHVP